LEVFFDAGDKVNDGFFHEGVDVFGGCALGFEVDLGEFVDVFTCFGAFCFFDSDVG
jgi:hypothetical protein